VILTVGDALCALLVYIGVAYLALERKHFALFNLFLVLAGVLLAVIVGREFRRLSGSLEQTQQ
jgi:hypothetical protein